MESNRQPTESVVREERGGALEVVQIWETIQGEGPFAGSPAVFVRLAGCNLKCPLCDTDYTSNRDHWLLKIMVQHIESVRPARVGNNSQTLVVLTGGEPFRQPIGPLCHELINAGYRVQVETNGTLYRSDMPWEYNELAIVCSPKTPKLHNGLLRRVTALKYVLAANYVSDVDGLPMSVLGLKMRVARPWQGFRGDIYLQPQDEQDPYQNRRNVQAVLDSCFKYGYRLCLQTHKIVGLP